MRLTETGRAFSYVGGNLAKNLRLQDLSFLTTSRRPFAPRVATFIVGFCRRDRLLLSRTSFKNLARFRLLHIHIKSYFPLKIDSSIMSTDLNLNYQLNQK